MSIAVLTSNESGANSLIDINANFADLDTTKADLASPTFTGTPVAPTPSANDNSTKLATTAYVDTAILSGAMTPIATATLSSPASTLTVTSIPARDIYRVVIYGAGITGDGDRVEMQFNGDTGNNYSSRYSTNGGAGANDTSREALWIIQDSITTEFFADFCIRNIANKIKPVIGQAFQYGATGGDMYELAGVWNNTTNLISSLTLTVDTDTLSAGTKIVIYG